MEGIMNYYLKSIWLPIFISLVIIPASLAQTYGQLFTKQEADKKFGPVLQSITLPKPTVQNFLSKTNNYIMFRVENNNVIVLDNKRNVLFPQGHTINSSDIFSMYSVSVIQELLSRANENSVLIEQRSEVLSVTYGGSTMELGVHCPPICD
jgi:hypothetical protein